MSENMKLVSPAFHAFLAEAIATERAAPSFVYYWYRAGMGTRPANALWINRNGREPERNAAPVREAASKHDTIWCYLSAFIPPEQRVVRDVLSETHERVQVVTEEKDASLELYRRRSRPGLER